MYGIGTTELIIIVIPILVIIVAIVIANKYSKKNSSDLRMSWFYFYTYVRLPIAVIISLANLLNVASNLYTLISVLYIAVLILVIYGHTKRKLWGWNLNLTLLVFETLFYSLSYHKGDIIQTFILFIIFALLWFLPNYIYFKKRIHLFT